MNGIHILEIKAIQNKTSTEEIMKDRAISVDCYLPTAKTAKHVISQKSTVVPEKKIKHSLKRTSEDTRVKMTDPC